MNFIRPDIGNGNRGVNIYIFYEQYSNMMDVDYLMQNAE